MKTIGLRRAVARLWIGLGTAVAIPSLAAEPTPESSTVVSPADAQADLRSLLALDRALSDMAVEMTELQLGVRLLQRGYYTGDEHDRIENLLFRFLGRREALWGLVERHRDAENRITDPMLRAKSFLLAYAAGLELANYTSLVIATFQDDEAVVHKLNEHYPRTDIAAGTYDRMFASLTKPENLQALRAAWLLFAGELAKPESAISTVLRDDPGFASLRLRIATLHRDADLRIEYLLMRNSLALPTLRNELRHSVVAALADKAKGAAGDGLAAAKGVLFTNVSRLRSPGADDATFTPEQLAGMKGIMQPGDIVLTFSDGYMSNLFLPGVFKHGLTYVGSPEQRLATGLPAAAGDDLPETKRLRLASDLAVARLPDGHEADLIEAVAEGVIFNSLAVITHGHLARLAVLRPRLPEPQRARCLAVPFLMLGTRYDFDFDFVDGSNLCCTEVIYRAYHKAGPIDFTLTKRAGVRTLAADDILSYHFQNTEKPVFEVVLMAEDNPDTRASDARVLPGREGEARLRALMKSP